ncbi:hypothetical protein A2716_00595 [candidate division WWE3 bacterium RIFCSPHIGHO2_01_FULL_40_23]|uniref:Aspartyl-tRNA amidotransferase n=1 Tax=candidate division WWE3 bacterium RIFCSPLOWO2_01_FULL_41_18 TaxID=1802625 RepID=A0A1F4VFK9_UNCKA|nr:MAG: hypothetical protein A2716_00595 [candidate division WWE3 bacterium RIFCSPHIGHO2_01_FULL_40_23]OGC55493.1 MAG: hypothetical protein A3A78_00865 [candidate division WWE3 bacterium RIFCSPLOWO2_01_FULL_41_18]
MSSSLLTKIQNDLVEAQKNRDELRVSTLRYLLSAVKNREIELRPLEKVLTDDEVIGVISKQVKQRKESIVEFEKGRRKDLVDKEAGEMDILKTYLPEEVSGEELSKMVDEAIKATSASEVSDMGKVMGYLMPKLKGRVDGSALGSVVRGRLQGL